MAQNNNLPGGCVTGIVRAFGGLLLISGFGNAMSGDVVPGVVVGIIGAAMLFGGLGGKKHNRRQPAMSAANRSQMSQEARQHAQKAAEAAERARELRAQKQQSAQPRQTAKDCPNPEPHRHYDLPRQPVSNAERMIENRKALYEAGLLTREEYDAEVRKLRGR